MSLAIIERQANGLTVGQRESDGYVNATKLCQAAGKLLADYLRLKSTNEYLEALSVDMGIPISKLVDIRRGKPANLQGTWVHPEVAIDLGQWLSPEFRILVNRRVREWMVGGSSPATSPRISAEFAALADEFFELIGETHTLIHRWADFARRLSEEIKTARKTSELERYASRLEKMLEIVNGIISLGSPATQVERSLVSDQMAKLIEEKFIANSTQTGCLERYTSKKKNKAGVVVEYPKINALIRDESIDEDWNWRYKYAIKEELTGKWKNKSKSVPLDKLPSVRAAIALDATLPTILRLIEG